MNTPNKISAAAIATAGTAIASTVRAIARLAPDPSSCDRPSGAALAAGGMEAGPSRGIGSAPMLTPIAIVARATPLAELPDHALDQVVHLLERDVGLLLLDAGGDDDLPRVVFERPL